MLQLKDPGNIRFFDVLNFSAKELAPDRRQPSTALAIWFAPRRKGTECPKESTMTTRVTETTAAPSEMAVKHFQEMLAFETDCWDVHESLKSANPDFIVVDVRGPDAFAKGHVKGALNIPHSEMTAARMAEYPKDKLLVVYCAGPHCNGANKAALRLARLGLPVKMMIGGVTGWIDEGFTLTPS
jgi:rhodanese-related sulfurtransferase